MAHVVLRHAFLVFVECVAQLDQSVALLQRLHRQHDLPVALELFPLSPYLAWITLVHNHVFILHDRNALHTLD